MPCRSTTLRRAQRDDGKAGSLDVETLTPIEALNFLYELKKTLKGSLNS